MNWIGLVAGWPALCGQQEIIPTEPPLNALARLGKVTVELPDGQKITAEHIHNEQTPVAKPET